jgi:aspartate carbamoyltransferase regulatory subunit
MMDCIEKTLSVSAICQGTVIDHIPRGQAFKIVALLKLDREKQQVTIGLNLSSKSMVYKDLIKIENRQLTAREADQITIFAPQATINLIHLFQVEKKIKPSLPEVIEHIFICPNSNCITRKEISSFFYVEFFKNHIYLRCKFCEKFFERDIMRTKE